jgi:hypothetical protein
MEDFKGTKAPWTVEKQLKEPILVTNGEIEWYHSVSYIKDQDGRIVADISYSTDHERMGCGRNETIQKWEANSLLISKAPLMLEMLKDILQAQESGEQFDAYWIYQLIKEATEI